MNKLLVALLAGLLFVAGLAVPAGAVEQPNECQELEYTYKRSQTSEWVTRKPEGKGWREIDSRDIPPVTEDQVKYKRIVKDVKTDWFIKGEAPRGWVKTGNSQVIQEYIAPTNGYWNKEWKKKVLVSDEVLEYEFVHANNPNHPNSPRWQLDGWNADSNPNSAGWVSTGNSRVRTPAVYDWDYQWSPTSPGEGWFKTGQKQWVKGDPGQPKIREYEYLKVTFKAEYSGWVTERPEGKGWRVWNKQTVELKPGYTEYLYERSQTKDWTTEELDGTDGWNQTGSRLVDIEGCVLVDVPVNPPPTPRPEPVPEPKPDIEPEPDEPVVLEPQDPIEIVEDAPDDELQPVAAPVDELPETGVPAILVAALGLALLGSGVYTVRRH